LWWKSGRGLPQSKTSRNRRAVFKARPHSLLNRSKPAIHRSGVSAERRKLLEIEKCGFLPKAATLLLQRFRSFKPARPANYFASGLCG
jgi:hypothetical protein